MGVLFGSVLWGLPNEFWQEHLRSESISWWHLLGVSRMPNATRPLDEDNFGDIF